MGELINKMVTYLDDNQKMPVIMNGQLVFFLGFLIFMPSPTDLLGASLGLKFGNILALIFIIIFLLYYRKVIIPKEMTFKLLILIFADESISLFCSIFIHPIVINDLFDIFRPILYMLTYILIYNLCNLQTIENYNIKKLNKIIFIFLLFSTIQLLNPFNVKVLMKYIYELDKSRTLDTISTTWRLSSTFTNPNYFGFFLSIICSIYLSIILNRVKNNIFILCLMIWSVILLLFTGSRTALIAMIVGLLIIILVHSFNLIHQGKVKRIMILFLIVIMMASITYFFTLTYIGSTFLRYSNTNNMELSLLSRYNAWGNAYNEFLKYPIIGNGPYNYLMDSFDNNYVYFLFRNGLLGGFIYIIFFIKNIISSLKLGKFVENKKLYTYLLSMIGTNVTLLISMSTAVTYNFIQLGSIYICMIAVQDKLLRLYGGRK